MKKNKMDLDMEIAAELGVARRKVSRVTEAFLDAIRNHLADDKIIHLQGFGRLRVQRTETTSSLGLSETTQYRVHFSKAQPFKQQLQERRRRDKAMEKFAVDENVNQKGLEKAAAEGCPRCGSKLEKHGNVLICPTHGSEPFEQGNDGGKENNK